MPFPDAVRQDALVQSRRYCCVCNEFAGVYANVHHIVQEADGGANDLDNAIVLCYKCHGEAGHYNPRHPLGIKYSPDELRKQRDKWWDLCDKNPDLASAVEPSLSKAIALFEGRVEVLTDELLSHPADQNRVLQYYAGAPLDWDIISANGDIQREQHSDLLQELLKPSQQLKFVCITAEPGAGKSTAAWHAAARLYHDAGALLIRVKDSEDPDVWYRMADFHRLAGTPFYVLADDLFRDPGVVSALKELNPWLPITVLATSRSNEYRSPRLKGELLPLRLHAPNRTEKAAILQRLGKTRTELTSEQRRRLDDADQFLVLMMELTAGRALREIVRDTIERLEESDGPACLAYEYLCFCCQYSISVPEALLERLDPQGLFHNLTQRTSTQALVFQDDGSADRLRVGHPVIAEAASRFFEERRSPTTLVNGLVQAVDVSSHQERRFAAHLLRALAGAKASLLKPTLPVIQPVITRCEQVARISELGIWHRLWLQLGDKGRADRCIDAVLHTKPVGAPDCNILLQQLRNLGREGEALGPIAAWVRENPDSSGGRQSYLRLVERCGTRQQVDDTVSNTWQWLNDHPDDSNVRHTYLGLVERKGTAEQVEQVVKETSQWLKVHDEDSNVRHSYLGLVERKGTAEQVEQVVRETSQWLKVHDEDSNVRTSYLGLVERHGNTKQVAQVVGETSHWLAQRDEDSHVRERYLGLVERKGTAEQIAQVVRETSQWLAQRDEDSNVRTSYLGLMERKGTTEQAAKVISETGMWLEKNPTAANIWSALIPLLVRTGQTEEAVGAVIRAVAANPTDRNIIFFYLKLAQDLLTDHAIEDLFGRLIEDNRDDNVLLNSFARWLIGKGRFEEARGLLGTLIIRWPSYMQARVTYGTLLLGMALYAEAEGEFRVALDIHKGFQSAHGGLAQALRGIAGLAEQDGRHSEAEQYLSEAEHEFRSAIYWAGRHKTPQAKHYTNLGWFYVDQGRCADAIAAFGSASDENAEFFGNYWGIGAAYMGLGEYEQALAALRTALEKAPDPLEPPASEDIPKRIQECEAVLAGHQDA